MPKAPQTYFLYFTHIYLALSVRYRLFTASRALQATGKMCTLQTGKFCYNAININYVLVLVYVQNCKRAQSLVRHGPS